MSTKEKVSVFQYINKTAIVVISTIVFFGYSYSYRMHLVDVKNTVSIKEDVVITSASVKLESRLDSSGFVDITYDVNSRIKVNIMPIDGVETAIISTPDGKYYVDIYTMRDYDLDLGLAPKNYGEYPKINCTSIGQFSTGGIIIEITQRLGSLTYANRVYLKNGELVDVGFNKKIGIRDETIYYDNVILIVNTISGRNEDLVRVYDDSTDEIIYNLSMEEASVEILQTNYDYFLCEAVGKDFIAFSSRYYDNNLEYFIDFNDETRTIRSVWDYVDINQKEMERLQYNEKATRGHSLVFGKRDNYHNLVYEILDIVNGEVVKYVGVPLQH